MGGGGVWIGRWTCVCFETRSLPPRLPPTLRETDNDLELPPASTSLCWLHRSLPPLLVHVVLKVKQGLPKGASSTLPNELYPLPLNMFPPGVSAPREELTPLTPSRALILKPYFLYCRKS